MPALQDWRRSIIIIVSTIIICHCLCTHMVDAKRVSKRRNQINARNAPRAGNQKRRGMIIKCCGKGSCSNFAPRTRNDSKLKTSTKSSTEKISVVTGIRTLPLEKATSPATALIQDEELLESQSASSSTTSEEETTQTLTESDKETTPAYETSSSASLSTSESLTNSESSSSTSTSDISATTPSSSTSTTTTTTTTTRPLLPEFTSDCSYTACPQKNNSLFGPDGALIDPPRYGAWRDVCGELYLFGKTIVSWDENARRCCSIGMLPISFETTNQFNCLFDIAKNEKWPYNMNYWTSGRRTHSNDTFQWCLINGTIYFSSSDSMWAAQQPDNRNGSESCVHLSVTRNQNGTQLTDRNCNDTYVFACKGSTTPSPKCFTPVCPNSTCEKNNSLYTVANDGVTIFLKDSKLHGTWTTINNRIYVFSKTPATWKDAAKACCAIGTKLLSVDNDYEYGMLSAAIYQSKGAVSPGQFWTSATDEGCEGIFGWCAVTKLIRGAIWANGKPEVGKRCVTVSIGLTNTTLKTSDCSTPLNYICETRDTGTAASGGKALKDECAAVYNVSDAEQDNIFNSTTYSRKVKCFLKCLGENGGFILNGRLVDETLIKMAEILSPNNIQQLQDDLSAVDYCSQKKGMDDCDTAALTFQCGQEKAPALLANAIASVELSSEMEKSPLQPTIGVCITDYSCVVNPAKQQAFASSSAVAEGFIETVCGKKYYISNMSMTYREAASHCCDYGLVLASVETQDELQCLKSSIIGGVPRPVHLWTSGTRKGTVNGFRWCSSKAPLNISHFRTDDSIGGNLYSLMTICCPDQTFYLSPYFYLDPEVGKTRLAFCEEQQ